MIIEEGWYYPFGLTMAGISSKAAGKLENKYKFTNQLFDDDLGWNSYQMKWRTMDPQIGRFLQIDPLAPRYAHNSTYAYAENDVIRSIDIEGLEKLIITHSLVRGSIEKVVMERIIRKNAFQENNIKLKDDNGKSVPITKNVLVLQNELTINHKKGDIVQKDGISSSERLIMNSGISTVQVIGKDLPNKQIEVQGNGIPIGQGDIFSNAGDIYKSSTGYRSGTDGSVNNQSEIWKGVISQINELVTVVPNIDISNLQIDLSGSSNSLEDLKRIMESLKLQYPGAKVNLSEDSKLKGKNKINYNATITGVTTE